MRWRLALLALGVFLVNGPAKLSAEPYHPEVGRRHPDFVLPSIEDRQPLALSQFRGKKVLLIHFASW